jgi:hypothetical protein
LLIYIGCEPGDGKGLTFWFEPIWHFRGPQGVLVGSIQAYEAAMTDDGLDALSELMDVLHEKPVEQVVLEPLTYDLSVAFAGGYWVQTFAADATTDHSWHIPENATGVRLKGCPICVEDGARSRGIPFRIGRRLGDHRHVTCS